MHPSRVLGLWWFLIFPSREGPQSKYSRSTTELNIFFRIVPLLFIEILRGSVWDHPEAEVQRKYPRDRNWVSILGLMLQPISHGQGVGRGWCSRLLPSVSYLWTQNMALVLHKQTIAFFLLGPLGWIITGMGIFNFFLLYYIFMNSASTFLWILLPPVHAGRSSDAVVNACDSSHAELDISLFH